MQNSKLTRVISLMLVMLFMFNIFEPLGVSMPAVTVYATTGESAKEKRPKEGTQNISDDIDYLNDENIELRFAHHIRMATNYANRMAADNLAPGEGGSDYTTYLKMHNIGVFFGYTAGELDTDAVQSPEHTRDGESTDTSVTYGRDLFISALGDGNNAARDYYNYGLLLSQIGFDSVGSDAPDTKRSALGGIALISYYAASSVNVMFEMMFNVLEATNPFQFFKDAAFEVGQDEINNISGKADTAIGTGTGKANLGKLRKYIGEIYKMFTEFAWAVAVPLALIFIIVAYFLSKNGRASFGSNVKKFFIRTAFLVMGIPILGSAYTQVLDALKSSQALSDDFLTQAVSYTFLDFGRWVETSRLMPVEISTGSSLDGDNFIILAQASKGSTSGDAVVPAKTWLTIRQMCYSLNETNKVFNVSDKQLGVDRSTGALLKDYIYDIHDGASPTLSVDTANGTSPETSWDNRESIKTMITKYMNGTKYTSGTFESGVKGYLRAANTGDASYGDLLALSSDKYSFTQDSERLIDILRSDSSFYNHTDPKNLKPWKNVAQARFNSGFTDWVGGKLWCNGNMGTDPSAGSSGGEGYQTLIYQPGGTTSGSTGGTKKNGLDPTQETGFSTMAMFTYLTSEFTQEGLIAYDGAAPSVYTQNAHYAVNLIGGDIVMQMAFFINMIAVLLGYFALAAYFVFRTAFEITFKGIQLIGHALFASLGFYKSIGTAICITVNMIAELFVSVIFFSFMVDFMFMMSSIFDNALAKLFAKVSGVTAAGAAGFAASITLPNAFKAEILTIISCILASLVIVFFVLFATKWRAAIMASLNSMVENIIGTLLGVQLSGASNGYMSGMAMSALNGTLNIAKTAAGVAGGIALADGAREMASDLMGINTVGSDGEDGSDAADAGIPAGEKSAADGAVAPTEGAGFDGGIGKTEGDAEVDRAEAEDALLNGVGGHSSGSFGDVDDSGGSADNSEAVNLSKTNSEEKLSDEAIETGSVDESDAASNNDGTYVDKDGNVILDRNGVSNAESGGSSETNNTTEATSGGTVETTSNSASSSSTENTNEITNENAASADSGDADDEADGSGVEIGIIGGGLGKKHSGGSHDKDESTTTKKSETTSSDGGTASSNTSETVETTVTENTAAEASNETVSTVESSVTEDEQGVLWSQTNPETGTETTARFDMERGLVVGVTNEDGTVSDVAIGMNGISTATVDAEGNEQTVAFSQNGIQTTYEGADGTHETVDVDASTGTSTIYRTDANGNSEEIVSDANGTVSTKTETAADGSTRVTTTDSSGVQTIEEKNATTGYEATETISADGSSVKTESLNGVTTVTNTNAEGEMTAQTITKLDSNGNEVVTSNSVAEDGSVTSSVTTNGVTTSTTTGADGSRVETQSVVRSDGTTVTTTTDYGTDTVADSVHTEVKSANGMETIQVSDTSAGKDSVGEYTSNVVKSASGTTETRDYGNGHVITTETSASGAASVTETKGDGNYTITETDAATGNVSITSLSSSGKGETVVRNANNDILSQTQIAPGENGSISYTNAAGGTIAMSTAGEGNDRESITVQSYTSGGQMSSAVNERSGSWTTTATDGMGSETVTAYDAKSGATTVQFAHINGNHGSSISESNGSYRQEVVTVDGGVSSVVREGSGENMTEVVTKIDAGGNSSTVTSKGGRIERVEAMTGGSASYVQEAGENGSVITRQTLENGSVVVTTAQANGDYVQETTSANGAKSYVESAGGVVTQKEVSITGIETTALRSGSAATETVTYGGIKMSASTDSASGQTTQTFTTSGGQVFTVEHGSEGVKNVVELGDGNYGSFRQNNDGSTVNIIRNASGSRRVETAADGTSTVVYTDASGNVVSAPQGADTFNDAFASGMSGFANNAQNVAIPAYMGYRVNNIIDNAQPQQAEMSSGVLNLSGTAGTVATGTAPTYSGGTQSDLSVSVTRGGSSGVKTKSFFEKMYSRMIKSEETEVEETEAVATTETKTQRKLKSDTPAGKLQRSSGHFGDYAERTGGSASQNNAQDNK